MYSRLKIRSQRKLNFLNNTESRVLAKNGFDSLLSYSSGIWVDLIIRLKVFETSISKASFCFLNQPEI